MIVAIEKAILCRLKAAADAGVLGYVWGLLESYPQDWDTYFRNKAQINAPAAWATFGGIEKSDDTNEGALVTASFGVVVAAMNLRNETATRHGRELPAGAKAEPGSYQLMLDAIGLLHGDDLDLDIGALMLVEAQQVEAANIASLRNYSLWAIRLRTSWTIPTLPFVQGEPADFTAFHANWDIPPFGQVDADPNVPGVQLPADATADATDHLEIPQ